MGCPLQRSEQSAGAPRWVARPERRPRLRVGRRPRLRVGRQATPRGRTGKTDPKGQNREKEAPGYGSARSEAQADRLAALTLESAGAPRWVARPERRRRLRAGRRTTPRGRTDLWSIRSVPPYERVIPVQPEAPSTPATNSAGGDACWVLNALVLLGLGATD
jgi:hypothetical protein